MTSLSRLLCARPRALGLALAVFGACTPATPGSTRAPSAIAVTGAAVSAFEVSVLDLDRERGFLSELGFESSAEGRAEAPEFARLSGVPGASARRQRLTLGAQSLFLMQFLEPRGRLVPVAHANDLGFEHVAIVVRDMNLAYAQLATTAMTPVSVAPQTLPASNPVAAGVQAAYFRDPEGHFMELIFFPPGRGDPVWQRSGGPLFLGIDHSAIVCRDTARSLRFYQEALGLQVKSRSLNVGSEQERLNGVAGARVAITSLRGKTGPGIELLQYLNPSDGRPFPSATIADSVSWQIAITVPDVDRALAALRAAGFAEVPEHGVNVSGLASQAVRAALVKDPDGHRVRLQQTGATEATAR